MSEVKQASASWKVVDHGIWDISIVDANSGGTICHINNKGDWFPKDGGFLKGRSQSKMLVDANLIATAPKMLSALRSAVCALAFAAERDPTFNAQYEEVSNVIAEATGAKP